MDELHELFIPLHVRGPIIDGKGSVFSLNQLWYEFVFSLCFPDHFEVK
jgi:hypothetical protein